MKKRIYTKPSLSSYGNVEKLTKKKGPVKTDGHQGSSITN